MTTQFKVGDIVHLLLNQRARPPRAQGILDSYLAVDQHFEVLRLDASVGPDTLLTVQCVGSSETRVYKSSRFELVPTIVAQPIVYADSWRWGDEEPVTSASPRRISDEERALIDQRIATKRKLRGDFS